MVYHTASWFIRFMSYVQYDVTPNPNKSKILAKFFIYLNFAEKDVVYNYLHAIFCFSSF